MAPTIPLPDDPVLSSLDLDVSSLELDARTAPLSLSSLSSLTKRAAAAAHTPPRNPSAGTVPASAINMKGVQAVFALIGASFVLAAIWFFFWARNGGFKWRRGDWDDYKSTVLRRKGPDGRTLSNATKSTRLGGGSVVGRGYSDYDGTMTESGLGYTATSFGGGGRQQDAETVGVSESASRIGEMKEKVKNKVGKKNKNKDNNKRNKPGETFTENPKERKQREMREAKYEGAHDYDVRAYRHEKPARVGGMNRQADGVGYGTEYSDSGYSGHNHSHNNLHRSSRQSSPSKGRRDYGFAPEDTFSNVSDNSQRPLRQSYNNNTGAPRRSSRQASPVKGASAGAAGRRSYAEPVDFGNGSSVYTGSVDGSSDTGTKAYHHPIPGLSGRTGGMPGGFRRGGGGGLSDSE
ncbi:MAG: hypothetical protein Q9227_003123 [Pyrenula ochraceoflavens]